MVMDMKLQMVDLHGQYLKIKKEVDTGIRQVIETSAFINGPQVKEFASNLATYSGCKHVITCGNGTDALQIALMSLGLKPGDEVIVPAFTYVASAEVIGLLGLIPVMVDVDYATFNVTAANLEKALSPKTKAIIPVHLFGQSCDMEPIMQFAVKHHLYVVEDNAQAIGATYTFSDGTKKHTGTIGHIGCTSFFPSKNLGCYGDGGAILTNDDVLAEQLRMIANHQYTLKVLDGKRDALKQHLADAGIPSMIYYPLPLQQQEAFQKITRAAESLDNAEKLAYSVLSLPVHTELTTEQQDLVIDSIKDFFK